MHYDQSTKKAVLLQRTPREAKAVHPSDWMRKFNPLTPTVAIWVQL